MYIKKYYFKKPSMLVNLLITQNVKELCNLVKCLIKATLARNSVMNDYFICISLSVLPYLHVYVVLVNLTNLWV